MTAPQFFDTLRVRLLSEHALAPTRAYPGDAGLDLFAAADVYIDAGQLGKVPTDIAIQLPPGTEGSIVDRSSMGLRSFKVTGGQLDVDYTGPITVLLINHSPVTQTIVRGQRIAQLVIRPIVKCDVEVVDSLPSGLRGDKGWGSSGK